MFNKYLIILIIILCLIAIGSIIRLLTKKRKITYAMLMDQILESGVRVIEDTPEKVITLGRPEKFKEQVFSRYIIKDGYVIEP